MIQLFKFMKNAALLVVVLVGGLTLCGGLVAQSRLPAGVDGNEASAESGSATRTVSKYLILERQLQVALFQSHDHDVMQFVDDGFSVRSQMAVDPLGLNTWMNNPKNVAERAGQIRNLQAQEFDDLVVVSFVLDPKRPSTKKAGLGSVFIVDVWRNSSSKLLNRQVGILDNHASSLQRPDGRE